MLRVYDNAASAARDGAFLSVTVTDGPDRVAGYERLLRQVGGIIQGSDVSGDEFARRSGITLKLLPGSVAPRLLVLERKNVFVVYEAVRGPDRRKAIRAAIGRLQAPTLWVG